jgi:hypothetical protein
MQIPKGMKQTPFRSLAESQKLLIWEVSGQLYATSLV